MQLLALQKFLKTEKRKKMLTDFAFSQDITAEFFQMEITIRACFLWAMKNIFFQSKECALKPFLKDRILALQHPEPVLQTTEKIYHSVLHAFNKAVPVQRRFLLTHVEKVQKCIDVAVGENLVVDRTYDENLADLVADLLAEKKKSEAKKPFAVIPLLVPSAHNFAAVSRWGKAMVAQCFINIESSRESGDIHQAFMLEGFHEYVPEPLVHPANSSFGWVFVWDGKGVIRYEMSHKIFDFPERAIHILINSCNDDTCCFCLEPFKRNKEGLKEKIACRFCFAGFCEGERFSKKKGKVKL